MEPLDLGPLVDEALAPVANQLASSQIQVVRQAPDHPAWVSGNAALLQQLVTNLVLNAANAMSEHGGVLRIALTEVQNQAVLEIADTGAGIRSGSLTRSSRPCRSVKVRAWASPLATPSCRNTRAGSTSPAARATAQP